MMSSETRAGEDPAGIAAPRSPRMAIAVFILANLMIPLLFGDLFPLTSTPMFRDRPQVYCNYRIYAPDGSELPVQDFALERVNGLEPSTSTLANPKSELTYPRPAGNTQWP